MEDVRIEKHGITLSMPWEGKSVCFALPLDEAISRIGAGVCECNVWKLMQLLTLAKEHHAELKEIYTKKKVYIVLDFHTIEELNEFCEALNQKN